MHTEPLCAPKAHLRLLFAWQLGNDKRRDGALGRHVAQDRCKRVAGLLSPGLCEGCQIRRHRHSGGALCTARCLKLQADCSEDSSTQKT